MCGFVHTSIKEKNRVYMRENHSFVAIGLVSQGANEMSLF